MPESMAMCIGNLFTAFGKQMTRADAMLYWRALHDVPVPLLDAAVTKSVREHIYANPPRPAQVRIFAEACRLEIRERYPWKKCDACRESEGWVPVMIDGIARVQRCECYSRALRTLRELGADGPALTAPPSLPESTVSEWKQLGAGDE
jgi:hypothetical protein